MPSPTRAMAVNFGQGTAEGWRSSRGRSVSQVVLDDPAKRAVVAVGQEGYGRLCPAQGMQRAAADAGCTDGDEPFRAQSDEEGRHLAQGGQARADAV